MTPAEERVIERAFDVIWHQGLPDHHDDDEYWRTKVPFWINNLRNSLNWLVAERDAARDQRECNGPRDCVGTKEGCRHC